MSLSCSVHMAFDASVRAIKTNEAKWLSIQSQKDAIIPDFALFFPQNTPLESIEAVADAIKSAIAASQEIEEIE